jgi:hypothetical protein
MKYEIQITIFLRYSCASRVEMQDKTINEQTDNLTGAQSLLELAVLSHEE